MANGNPPAAQFFGKEGLPCPTINDTRAAGAAFAASLERGAIVSLDGPLGAGKTCFIQGLAEGLGMDPSAVSSPTFTLVHEYSGGRIPLLHFDLYRLEKESELEALGWDDSLQSGAICAVEWGGKFPHALPPETRWLKFVIEGQTRRIIEVTGE